MRDTWPLLCESDFPAIERDRLEALQMNLGYLCNLSCIHCHVNAGPHRKELMDQDTMRVALLVAERHRVSTLDLTGGSPEMNPHFRWRVTEAKARGIYVTDRLNPTLMEESGYEWVGAFLAANPVDAVASLPCYSQANVGEQRGNGVFHSSIRALKKLNDLGYGQADHRLTLNLVYNPNGAFLPPDAAKLEAQYKQLLGENFGLVFDKLYAIAKMPVQRYRSWLLAKGHFGTYMGTLKAAHRTENLVSVMCRTMLSVDYQGKLYDCDFNQMLKLPLGGRAVSSHLRDLLDGNVPRRIAVAEHGYGCTAGQGSSCGGALNL